ncbi:MAG TPA: hypothetical protein VGS20_14125 [Candidatus Acidoferrales bacterium]|nr:hypothetical protein [Candidatus Acidoferrales bacterium]
MNETSIEQSIASLGSAVSDVRSDAARLLYKRGCGLAKAWTEAWRRDAALGPLLAGEPTVGVAVRPETFARIRRANGAPPLAEVPPDQDALEFELRFPGGISLDILTTRQPGGGGAVARFLDRRGEGVQQVELPVANLDRATTLLRERFGLEPVYPAGRAGADGKRVNFFLAPVAPGGPASGTGSKVLIELVEANS